MSSAYNAIGFELGIRDTRALVANIYRADAEITQAIKDAAARGVAIMDQVWESLTPVDTTFMVRHRRIKVMPSGLGFEAGWDATDFFNEGLAFYPWFQEFGTMNMRAQPSLGPAYRYMVPIYQSELTQLIRSAIDRVDTHGRHTQ